MLDTVAQVGDNRHSLSAVLASGTGYAFFFSVMPLEFSFYSKFHSLLSPLEFVKAIVSMWCSVFLADRRDLNLFSLMTTGLKHFWFYSHWQESRLGTSMSIEGKLYM